MTALENFMRRIARKKVLYLHAIAPKNRFSITENVSILL